MTSRPLVLSSGLAALFTLSALPAAAQAGAQPDVTSHTTYRVVPESASVVVTAKTRIANKVRPKKGATRVGFSGWGPLVMPAEAVDLAIKGRKVTSEQTYDDGGQVFWTTSFPPLWHRKKTTVTTRYTLPSQSAGEAGLTRVEPGYVHVCWPGQYGNRGRVTLEISGLGWEQYHEGVGGTALSSVADAETTTVTSSELGLASQRFRCSELLDPARLTRTLTGTAVTPVVVRSWDDDPAWPAGVAAEAGIALSWLEAAFGPLSKDGVEAPAPAVDDGPIALAALTIDQAATQAFPHSTGAFAAKNGRLPVAEGQLPPGAVSVPLARSWFGVTSPITSPWLREGLAAWSGYQAIGESCPEVPAFPEFYEAYGPDLDGGWVVPTHRFEWDLWDWQSATACKLVGQAAEIVGPEAMMATIESLTASLTPTEIDDFFAVLVGHNDDALPGRFEELSSAMVAAGVDDVDDLFDPSAHRPEDREEEPLLVDGFDEEDDGFGG